MSERPLRENATRFIMKKKQLKVTNPKQMECLVLALEQNEYMARVKGKNGPGKTMAKVFWSNLADKLNTLGPPMRDGNGWLKVWNDQKYLVKQKVKRSNDKHTTPVGRYKYINLSSLEETIAKILRLRDTVKPIESVDIKAAMSEDSNTFLEEECPDNEEREEFEETQDDNFLLSELISTETIQTITSVCASVERKIEEQTAIQKSILEEQKQTNRMLRKLLRHKEEKLSLMKMELLEKQKYEKRILELKINYHDQLDKDFLAD